MNYPSRTDDTGREGWNQNPPSLAADTTTRQDLNGLANSRLRQDDDSYFRHLLSALVKYASFIGPGFLISVAYIDPGNYSTDVAAGTTYRFQLLFIVLLSNLFAIFLQSLCIKLGTVTGLNLAEHIRMHCPGWLNIILYLFAEAAIVATDIAEVCRGSGTGFEDGASADRTDGRSSARRLRSTFCFQYRWWRGVRSL